MSCIPIISRNIDRPINMLIIFLFILFFIYKASKFIPKIITS